MPAIRQGPARPAALAAPRILGRVSHCMGVLGIHVGIGGHIEVIGKLSSWV
jgi:hypothetical protein